MGANEVVVEVTVEGSLIGRWQVPKTKLVGIFDQIAWQWKGQEMEIKIKAANKRKKAA